MHTSILRFTVLMHVLAIGCTANNSAPPPAPVAIAPAPAAELVENPQYTSWAKFKPGTVVVQRSVTESEGIAEKTTTIITNTLVELTVDYAAISTQASTKRYDGLVTDNPPDTAKQARLIPLPPGVKKEDFGKPTKGTEHGEETVTVDGKAYRATWYTGKDRNEGGEVRVRTWLSPDVPGGLVKSVMRVIGVGKTTTIETIDVKLP